MAKQIGNVYESEEYVQNCPCGEKPCMQRYVVVNEAVSMIDVSETHQDGRGIYLAICKCGNIYAADLKEYTEHKAQRDKEQLEELKKLHG